MKNILIIGASKGIGLSTALLLADTGSYQVTGTYKETPQPSVNNIKYHRLDVSDMDGALADLPDTLHGLVYCPGSIHLKPFARIKPEEFNADFNLQVTGAVRIIQAVLPKLKASGHASIVLFSTVAVQTGFNFHSLVSTSKGAVEGLTRALSAELAPHIRVNCIAPSVTDTPLAAGLLNTPEKKEANAMRHPLKRIGEAGDIANMVEFLLSDRSSWMTGQVLHVDGGISVIR